MANRKVSDYFKDSLVESGIMYPISLYYFGTLDDDPTARIDGSALQIGDMYFSTNIGQFRNYNGTEFGTMGSDATEESIKQVSFTGDGSTTEFTVDGGYTANTGLVFTGGSNVTDAVDISDGIKVVFDEAPADGADINCYFFATFELANSYTKVETDMIAVNIHTDVSADTTVSVGNTYRADTTNGSFTLTLPDTPQDGDRIVLLDIANNFDNDSVILDGNGNKVQDDDTFECNLNNKKYEIYFYKDQWRVFF